MSTLVARMNLHFHSDQLRREQQVGGQYANVFMLTSTENGLGFVLKTTRFNDSESTLL